MPPRPVALFLEKVQRLGYRAISPTSSVAELGPGLRGWVALITRPLPNRVLELGANVGARIERVEQEIVRLRDGQVGPANAPTVMDALYHVKDPMKWQGWRIDLADPEPGLDAMYADFVTYGVPFIARVSEVAGAARQVIEDRPTVSPYKSPMLLWLAGDPVGAEQMIERMIARERDNPRFPEFMVFVEKLRAEMHAS